MSSRREVIAARPVDSRRVRRETDAARAARTEAATADADPRTDEGAEQ